MQVSSSPEYSVFHNVPKGLAGAQSLNVLVYYEKVAALLSRMGQMAGCCNISRICYWLLEGVFIIKVVYLFRIFSCAV